MNAQSLGPITRLTIRSSVAINADLRRDEKSTRAVIALDRTPLDALQERLDHKDRLVRSIVFDDSDAASKIVMDLTNEVKDIKIASADNNRVLFIDVMREAAKPLTTAPPTAATAAKPDTITSERRVRVIVIDPGHGGMDNGATGSGMNEKDLTLVLARKLRAALQTKLGGTVLLTRDSDVEMDNGARSAVANNNQANLFISLHVGYSPNKVEAGSSIFIMKEDFGDVFSTTAVSRDQLFLPWYLGYRTSRRTSAQAAKVLQEDLTKAVPGWQFPVRTAPLAVLSSVTMPSVLLEIGNLNNQVNAQTLSEAMFQNKLVDTIVAAVARFSSTQQPSAN